MYPRTSHHQRDSSQQRLSRSFLKQPTKIPAPSPRLLAFTHSRSPSKLRVQNRQIESVNTLSLQICEPSPSPKQQSQNVPLFATFDPSQDLTQTTEEVRKRQQILQDFCQRELNTSHEQDIEKHLEAIKPFVDKTLSPISNTTLSTTKILKKVLSESTFTDQSVIQQSSPKVFQTLELTTELEQRDHLFRCSPIRSNELIEQADTSTSSLNRVQTEDSQVKGVKEAKFIEIQEKCKQLETQIKELAQSRKHESRTSESDLVEGGRESKLLNESLLNCSISDKERSQNSQQLKEEIAKVTLQLNKLCQAQRNRKAAKTERISITYRQSSRKSINTSLLNPVLTSRNKSPNISRIGSNSLLNTSRETKKNDSRLNSSRGEIKRASSKKRESVVNLNLKPMVSQEASGKKRNQKSKTLAKYSPCTRSELTTPRLKGRKDSSNKSFDFSSQEVKKQTQEKSREKGREKEVKQEGSRVISKEEIYAAILDFPPKMPISIFEPESQVKQEKKVEELIVKERRISRSPKRKSEVMEEKIEALMASVEIRQLTESDEEEELRTEHTRLTMKHYTNNTIPEESADGDTSYMSSNRPHFEEERAARMIQRAFRRYRERKRVRMLQKKKALIDNILKARSSNTATAKRSTGGLDRALLTTAQIVRETSVERQKKRGKQKHAFKPSMGEHSPGRKMCQKIENYREAVKRRKNPAVRLVECSKVESKEHTRREERLQKGKLIRSSLLRSCAASLCATQLMMWRNMMQHYEEKK